VSGINIQQLQGTLSYNIAEALIARGPRRLINVLAADLTRYLTSHASRTGAFVRRSKRGKKRRPAPRVRITGAGVRGILLVGHGSQRPVLHPAILYSMAAARYVALACKFH
jgi:hypothetical protein